MTLLLARAARWVDDEPFPGLVEVVFTDAESTDRVLIDKCVNFGDSITRAAAYPVVVEIPVEVLPSTDHAGRVGVGHPVALGTR